MTSIKIQVGDKTFEFTPEEARKVREELNQIFGDSAPQPILPAAPMPIYPVCPLPNTPLPSPHYPPHGPNDWPFQTWCGTDGSKPTFLSGLYKVNESRTTKTH